MQDTNSIPPIPPSPNGTKKAVPDKKEGNKKDKSVLKEVVSKILESENVLVALSANPSVDEMSAAIALTLTIEGMGKHATAIYSGKTPNVLEFLKPEETFETNTNSLQDFIIALNKDKADHLRYKVDGDYVKVFITPYKTTLDESDLEFSRGDYNVDLVISLNVPAATELDGALREYGRIMHDATSINITNGAAGKFGDIEWVDANASSCSEMVSELIFELVKEVDSRIATALLAGIVSATDRFTNGVTTSEVMMLAGKLMKAGADQQDVIRNISQELEFLERKESAKKGTPEAVSTLEVKGEPEKVKDDEGTLELREGALEAKEESEKSETEVKQPESPADAILNQMEEKRASEEQAVASQPTTVQPAAAQQPTVSQQLTEVQQPAMQQPVMPQQLAGIQQPAAVQQPIPQPEAQMMESQVSETQTPEGQVGGFSATEAVIQPDSQNGMELPDYSKMIEDALNEPSAGGVGMMPNQGMTEMNGVQDEGYVENPAMMNAPGIGEMNDMQEEMPAGAPGMDYGQGNFGLVENPSQSSSGLPMPGQEIAPPPVAPMPDFGSLPPVAMPGQEMGGQVGFGMNPGIGQEMNAEMNSEGQVMNQGAGQGMNPEMGNNVNPGVNQGSAQPQQTFDPGAFRIPGV